MTSRPVLAAAICAAMFTLGCGRTPVAKPDFGLAGSSADAGDAGDDGNAGTGGKGGGKPARCGNDRKEGSEECDGSDLGGATCEKIGRSPGTLGCNADCGFDRSGCGSMTMPPPMTGCDALSGGSGLPTGCLRSLCECTSPQAFASCDENCLAVLRCAFGSCGTSPSPDCVQANCGQRLDTLPPPLVACLGKSFSECGPNPMLCGNGQRDSGESCDGMDLGNASCSILGFGSGFLSCSNACTFDTSGCQFGGQCGDGVLSANEDCDGSLMRYDACSDLGYEGGALRCTSQCVFDVRDCSQCGDGRVQVGEACDGDNLGGLTCGRFGFASGSLECNSSCDIDTTYCAKCNNGVVEPGENCDGSQLAGESCESLGLGSGTLSCHAASCHFVTTACDTNQWFCGNGVAEAGEECDIDDLTQLTCTDLGYRGGELGCNDTTCRFDTSGCEQGAPNNGESCAECREQSCEDVTELCLSDPRCIGGLECLRSNCGTKGDIGCATTCFMEMNSAIAAVSMFACVVTECGEPCLGDL